jgi:hypothetical protein
VVLTNVPSLSFEHVIFIYVKENNAHDAQNQRSEKIAIYEEYNLWQSPSEPSRWDQGIAGGIKCT